MRGSRTIVICVAMALALTLRGQPAPSAIPASCDLRPVLDSFGLKPRLQGERPTCSVFTFTEGLEFAIAKKQGNTPRLSVEFLNWAANKTCGDSDDGGFFTDMWKGFSAYGICAEGEMGYETTFDAARLPSGAALADAKTRLSLGVAIHWIKDWDVRTGLTPAELVGIKQILARGWPVCSGSRWPKEERWVGGVLQLCPASEVRDGHSVLLVGYRDDSSQPGGGVFLFRNTGDDGKDGMMPYAYAQDYMNDAVWAECVGENAGGPAAR